MRDEAVASQDQDPTTEGVPAGQTPDGRGAGPSDASETIVSGSHAAATGPREEEPAPAEHDAWDAEFAGLTGTPPEPVQASANQDAASRDTATPAAANTDAANQASANQASANQDAANQDAANQDAANQEAAPVQQDEAAPTDTEDPEDAGTAAAARAKTREREEVPGGHPSLAQRSTLPMRAASTMPDLGRYSTGSTPEGAARTETESAVTAAGAGPDTAAEETVQREQQEQPERSEPHPTAAAGGPWYGPGAAEKPGAEDDAAQTEEPPPADPEISTEEAARRSAERERAATAKPVLGRVIQVGIAVFFPVMLMAAAIRAVATPVFLWLEYNRPGFPADSFGFSSEDRMTYGSYAVDYLLNFASPRYLGDLVTPDGDPLYLASEVSHMADVKAVLTLAFLTALGMALLSLAGSIYLARRCPGGIRRALFAGAVTTLAVIAGLLVAAVLAWEEFFTMVHTIFFAQGNWTFRLDDTLIRLFPAQFWMDAGAAIAGIVLLVCVLVMVFTWPTKKRRERSRLAREETRRRYEQSLEAL